ncbi:hypothetical protein [Kitasatospora sp. NPDC088548]|uniref:hypothetical protein n=1 Tax=Kitasatospora sp. NPDC088548 TaxID=3364075 RepID=UPI003814F82B
MPYEDDLANALRGAAELAPRPHLAAFAAGAAARGRVIRRRRRAAVLAVSTGMVLLALTAAAVLPGGGGGGVAPAGEQPITGAFMERTVRTLLPPGTVSDAHGAGLGEVQPPQAGPQVVFVFDDGHGPTRLSLTTERVALPVDASTEGTECMTGDQPGECERTVRPDGTIVLVQSATGRPGSADRTRTVLATGPDGRRIRLDAVAGAPGQTATATDISITVPQMVAIVTSGDWDPVFGALVAPKYPKTAFSGLPAARIAETAVALLPQGVTATVPEGRFGDGQSDLTLAGRDRQAHLGLTAQRGAVITREAFESSVDPNSRVRTADGTSVVRREVQADSDENGPVLSWAVEALHPDGTRVSAVQTAPGVWPDVPPLPGREVLTMDQLVTLTASPTWRG